MAELKTFWTNPGMPVSTDLGGDTITASGSDPNADATTDQGDNACDPLWSDSPVPELTSDTESANSVSGLPSLPNRFEPASTPPPPPTLQDRRPGTIDEQ